MTMNQFLAYLRSAQPITETIIPEPVKHYYQLPNGAWVRDRLHGPAPGGGLVDEPGMPVTVMPKAKPPSEPLYEWPDGSFRIQPMPGVLMLGYGPWNVAVPVPTSIHHEQRWENKQILPARDASKLPEALKAIGGGMIVDIRIESMSPIPGWSGAALRQLLEDRYAHVPELGNKAKDSGRIEILDMEGGISKLNRMEHWPLVLICTCRSPKSCHRSVVAEGLRAAKMRSQEWEY